MNYFSMKKVTEIIAGLDEGMARVEQIVPGMPIDDVRLYKLLTLTAGAMQDELARNLKPHGMAESDFHALMMLFSSPNGSASPSELACVATQSSTNMTRIANSLVKKGLITRAHAVDDRRRIVMRITPAGRRFVNKLLPPMFPRLAATFATFSAREKTTLQRMLRTLAQSIDDVTARGDE